MERAIAEINDARARHRRLLRRPDDLRLQGGVRAGEALPRPDRRASRSSSSRGTTTRATSATSTSRSSSATATRCCARTASRSSPSTRPSPTSTTARSAAAATAGSRSSSREPADLRIFVLHHHLLPIPGHRPRAQHRLRRRRRDRVPAARRRAISSSPGTSTCRMRGGSRTCSSSTPARSRRCGCAATRGPVTTWSRSTGTHVAIWRRYPFHGQERIIQFDLATLEYEKYTGRIEREVTHAAVRAVALIDGEHYAPVVRDALAELPYEWVGAILVGGTREAARRRRLRRAARRRLRRRRGRRRPLGRAGARPGRALPLGVAARSPPGLPYVGADFRFDPPAFEPFDAAVDRRDRHRASASARPRSRRTSRVCSRATATSSSSRWAAAGRPSPR